MLLSTQNCNPKFDMYFFILSCSLILCHFQALDMEGHKVDDDVDLSNDEELPPDLSTKEPKASFTTAQVEELGQALGFSQLHRSLENISTFLERKFNEDSDVLEQISDKETTSYSKRKASNSTSKRHRSAESLSSVTQQFKSLSSVTKQLKSLSSVPQQRKIQSRVTRLLTPLLTIF